MAQTHDDASSAGAALPPPRRCTRVRSTLILGSIQALQGRGLGERYRALIDAEALATFQAIGGPRWLPLELALRHYAACEGLALGEEAIFAVGAELAMSHTSGVGVLLHAARAAGATPWALIDKLPKYWGRMYDGSSIAGASVGPKDARVVVTGQPLASIAYWRTGLRGILTALAGALCRRVHVRELSVAGGHDEVVSYTLSWA